MSHACRKLRITCLTPHITYRMSHVAWRTPYVAYCMRHYVYRMLLFVYIACCVSNIAYHISDVIYRTSHVTYIAYPHAAHRIPHVSYGIIHPQLLCMLLAQHVHVVPATWVIHMWHRDSITHLAVIMHTHLPPLRQSPTPSAPSSGSQPHSCDSFYAFAFALPMRLHYIKYKLNQYWSSYVALFTCMHLRYQYTSNIMRW